MQMAKSFVRGGLGRNTQPITMDRGINQSINQSMFNYVKRQHRKLLK